MNMFGIDFETFDLTTISDKELVIVIVALVCTMIIVTTILKGLFGILRRREPRDDRSGRHNYSTSTEESGYLKEIYFGLKDLNRRIDNLETIVKSDKSSEETKSDYYS